MLSKGIQKIMFSRINKKYPTTASGAGKKVVPICSHCGELQKDGKIYFEYDDELKYNGSRKLKRFKFDTFIKNNFEKNLIVEPSIHTGKKVFRKRVFDKELFFCPSCGTEFNSCLAIKIFNIVVLLCM
jgi:hypothetical protein